MGIKQDLQKARILVKTIRDCSYGAFIMDIMGLLLLRTKHRIVGHACLVRHLGGFLPFQLCGVHIKVHS